MESLIAPMGKSQLAAEVASLSCGDKLTERGDFEVYLSSAAHIPNILMEIGRLREMTFRAVGEGTGKSVDLDEFDQYYSNLFIWDKENCKVVGGYRVGFGKKIFAGKGLAGFYINSLFDIDEKAAQLLENSIELGRSYITEEYQKAYLPFFLLWKGILIFWLKNPEYNYLIGPVSISKFYSDISKSIIVGFAEKHFMRQDLAPFFKPKTPFAPDLKKVNLEEIAGSTVNDLEKFLSKIEPPHVKVPIMIKQYVKLNARFLSFNLDPNFSDALDGLMLLDLNDLPTSMIQMLQEK